VEGINTRGFFMWSQFSQGLGEQNGHKMEVNVGMDVAGEE